MRSNTRRSLKAPATHRANDRDEFVGGVLPIALGLTGNVRGAAAGNAHSTA